MAGAGFAPQKDRNTFTPFYLRYATPDYAKRTPEQKLAALPTLGERESRELGQWVRGIDSEKVTQVLRAYDVEPGPILDRLAALKNTALPMDQAINRAWSTGL